MLAFLGGTGTGRQGIGAAPGNGRRDRGHRPRGMPVGPRRAADELLALAPGAAISGAVNPRLRRSLKWFSLTMPYNGMSPTIAGVGDALDGKVVVTVIAPMRFERGVGAIAEEVAAGSAAQEAQARRSRIPRGRRVSERVRRGAAEGRV